MKFKNEYAEWIIEGTKTQTLRKHCDYDVGDVFKVNIGYICGSVLYKVCKMKITSIEKVSLHELTNDDAEREGFKSVAELVLVLKEIYEDIEASSLLYRVRFEKVISEIKDEGK